VKAQILSLSPSLPPSLSPSLPLSLSPFLPFSLSYSLSLKNMFNNIAFKDFVSSATGIRSI